MKQYDRAERQRKLYKFLDKFKFPCYHAGKMNFTQISLLLGVIMLIQTIVFCAKKAIISRKM